MNYEVYFVFLYSAFILIVLNVTLIGFLMIHVISHKYNSQKQAILKSLVENVIFEKNSPKKLQKIIGKDFVLLENIIFEYLAVPKNSVERDRLLDLAKSCKMIDYYLSLLNKKSITLQNIACMRLGSLMAVEAIPKLLILLETNTTTLFLNAANAIVKITGPLHLYVIIKRLMDFEKHENYSLIRKRIMNMIAEIKDDIFETLDKLINSKDKTQILFSIEILSYRKDSRANPYIYKLLEHSDEGIRSFANGAAKSMGLL